MYSIEYACIVDGGLNIQIFHSLVGSGRQSILWISIFTVGVDVILIRSRIVVVGRVRIFSPVHLAEDFINGRVSDTCIGRQSFGKPIHLPVHTVENVVIVTACTCVTFVSQTCIQCRSVTVHIWKVSIRSVRIEYRCRIGVHGGEIVNLACSIQTTRFVDVHEARAEV